MHEDLINRLRAWLNEQPEVSTAEWDGEYLIANLVCGSDLIAAIEAEPGH